MGVFIQRIRTEWTKESRGGAMAALRNQTPELFRVPDLMGMKSIAFQKVEFSEFNSFKVPKITGPKELNDQQVREEGLAFAFEDDKLRTTLWRNFEKYEKFPHQSWGSWMKLRWNRRTMLGMDGMTGYYKIVLNIYFGDLKKISDRPLTDSFSLEVDRMSILY